MTASIHETWNITDNWFTSIKLTYDMIINCYCRDNSSEQKRNTPNRGKGILSSQFAFHEKNALVSFTHKTSKSVILINSAPRRKK